VGLAINGYVSIRCHRLASQAKRKRIEALVGVLFAINAVFSKPASLHGERVNPHVLMLRSARYSVLTSLGQ
jgi:hypothetical protein